MSRPIRKILGLSGGKDSTALAVYMHKYKKVKDIEFFFCDTGCELPETYEFIEKIKAKLGIHIEYLKPELPFETLLKGRFKGFLPSAKQRWCTVHLKIIPLEKWIGTDTAISYIGIRADEDRDGYISSKDNITPNYPFKEDGLTKKDIFRILEESGIGLPKYYEWRSRSGCYFCFFQQKYEWVMLSERHPDLFLKAMEFETNHSDGRKYYWNEFGPLSKILEHKEEIIKNHKKKNNKSNKGGKRLIDTWSMLFEEDDSKRCSLCQM